MLDAFYRVAFRKKIYATIDDLQADLDLWMRAFNEGRPHQGKWCFGKTPLQTFLDALPIAREKTSRPLTAINPPPHDQKTASPRRPSDQIETSTQDVAPGARGRRRPAPSGLGLGLAAAPRPRTGGRRQEDEIVAIPGLLERLELEGALLTIDAMGCQRDIAEAIRTKGPIISSPSRTTGPPSPTTCASSSSANPRAKTTSSSVDGDDGRIETRRCRISQDVAWLSTSRRFPGEPRFPALATIGMIEAEVEGEGKTSISRRYYLSSAILSAGQFAAAARAHRGVENRLHWVLDVVFHDDLMRLKTENGPANMAVVKHFILNLIKEIPGKASLKTRRKTLGWDDQYLADALLQT